MIELYQSKDDFKTHVKGLQANPNPEMSALRVGDSEVVLLDVVGPPGLKSGSASLAIVAELKVCRTISQILKYCQRNQKNKHHLNKLPPPPQVKADGNAGFEEATLPLINDVQSKEDGNLLYCFGKDPKDPTTYIVTELYTDMPVGA